MSDAQQKATREEIEKRASVAINPTTILIAQIVADRIKAASR